LTAAFAMLGGIVASIAGQQMLHGLQIRIGAHMVWRPASLEVASPQRRLPRQTNLGPYLRRSELASTVF